MTKARRSSGRTKPSAGKRIPLDPELLALVDLLKANRFSDIEPVARRILAKRPQQPLAMKALAFSLINQHRYEEALPILEYSAGRCPQDPELHNNQGIALACLMRWEEALVCYERARRLTPDDPELLKNIGGTFLLMNRWNDAVSVLLEAIEKHPGDFVEAIVLLANALVSGDRLDEAMVCLREICADDATNLAAVFLRIWAGLKLCQWDGLLEELALLQDKSEDFMAPLNNPFRALPFPGLTGGQLRRIAECHCREALPQNVRTAEQWIPDASRHGKQRLRIAYISGDFRVHAVGLIIPEMLERHDRSRVEVFAYSTKEDDGSELGRRLEAAFDRFVAVAGMPVHQLAERIRADRIDVLIDLSGWTTGGRAETLYLRCAPVQVNWLGYGGTMGHTRLADYIIGDPIVTPLEHTAYYTETIAQLPHCYLPADTTRTVGERPTRIAAGLPENVFVFCSFNNSYKYNPALFDLWGRLLNEAPDSVLWLAHPGESAAKRLRAEMQRRGVPPDRLIFALRVDAHSDHIARLQLADLALDTFPYNSHSTGVDTLWAGVPMVTCLGGAFSSRVGASIVTAANLPDLVTATPEAYLALALELYRSPEKLASMRRRLNEGKLSLPLFNMKAFATSMENLYFSMWQNFVDGDVKPILSTPLVTVD